ncbi:hypothetical protein RB600_008875 [Gaeumannomyces tritici]
MAALVPETPAVGDEVKPYKIHVSSKYLDLTRQKLELTRLPHENAGPRSADWWEPKPSVEPLIDYWLERFSWRDQEARLNTLPQFRTSLALPGGGDYLQAATATATATAPPPALRVHFLHFRSPQLGAVPLLLVPPFPFTNLSLAHLAAPLTDPAAGGGPAFHVVVPSLPGLGFSDALPSGAPAVPTSAELLDGLMRRLGYARYLATGAASARSSPARVDWLLLDRLATHHRESCRGVHLISPPLARPSLASSSSVVELAKWLVISLFGLAIWGYCKEDLAALSPSKASSGAGVGGRAGSVASGRSKPRNGLLAKRRKSLLGGSNGDHKGSAPAGNSKSAPNPHEATGLGSLGLREPNTIAYALCDSPTGLLVFIIKMLRLLAGPGVAGGGAALLLPPDVQAAAAAAEEEGYYSDYKKTTSTVPTLTYERVVTLANLAWLPGPEYALRFWAQCAAHGEAEAEADEARARALPGAGKPRVAITVFLGGDGAVAASPVAYPTAAAVAAVPATETKAGDEVDVEKAAGGGGGGSGAGQKSATSPNNNDNNDNNNNSNNNNNNDDDKDDGSGVVSGSELAELAELPAGACAGEPYVCPAWGRSRYDVAFAQRAPGRPGLLAWERPEVVVAGVRGLAVEALAQDMELRVWCDAAAATTAQLESVVIGGSGGGSEVGAGTKQQQPIPPSTPPAAAASPRMPEGADRKREIRPPTIVEEAEPSTPSPPRSDRSKGKGKGLEEESPPPPSIPPRGRPAAEGEDKPTTSPSPTAVGSPSVPLDELLRPPARDLFTSDDESPDTLVVTTPPLGGTPPVASPVPK